MTIQQALHITTRILPGGKIEVASPQLQAGEPVDVFIVRGRTRAPARRSIVGILAEAPGHRLFANAEQVDAYLQEEHDSWDR